MYPKMTEESRRNWTGEKCFPPLQAILPERETNPLGIKSMFLQNQIENDEALSILDQTVFGKKYDISNHKNGSFNEIRRSIIDTIGGTAAYESMQKLPPRSKRKKTILVLILIQRNFDCRRNHAISAFSTLGFVVQLFSCFNVFQVRKCELHRAFFR